MWRISCERAATRRAQFFGEVEFRFEVGGVVGTADEWAGSDVAEAFAFGDDLEVGELVRVDVLDDREVLFRGAEVLSEC